MGNKGEEREWGMTLTWIAPKQQIFPDDSVMMTIMYYIGDVTFL